MRARSALLRSLATATALLLPSGLSAQASRLYAELDRRTAEVNARVVAWRRDIHEHPELGMQETRTAALVAAHLRSLGMEVREKVGGTGVVGVLRGGKPGKVVALRADMDGLPVTEMTDLPFRSRVRTTWNGNEVGVMHACGHDNHVAILMGAAEVLAGMKAQLPGTVVFLFQPAEEGPGGAEPMIADGALENPKVEAIFGLHVWPGPGGQRDLPRGPDDGRRQRAQHQDQGEADAWRGAVGRRRPHRGRLADRARAADHRQPADQHHPDTGDRDGRAVPWRHPRQHHPRLRDAERHHPDL
jgi:metal-dependent amidase/aminoacylase/carboxypeptidase family protein